jgi:hypothetical protein
MGWEYSLDGKDKCVKMLVDNPLEKDNLEDLETSWEGYNKKSLKEVGCEGVM